MLLTSSCSHQNHTKNPQHLPMRRESTCHLVEHIISSWRKKTNKKTTLSDCWTQCPPITASNVPHSPLPPCHCDATLPSSSVSSHESNILPPFQLLFLISNPNSHHTLFSLLRHPPPFPSSRGHTVSYGTLVVLKASSPLFLNAWLTSTLSLGNSYRSGVDRGGQRCSLPCCKKKPWHPTENSQTHKPKIIVIVVLVSFGNKALRFICVRNLERIGNFPRLPKPFVFF